MDTTIPEVPAVDTHTLYRIKNSFGVMREGFYTKFIQKMFGCEKCPYFLTSKCPHNSIGVKGSGKGLPKIHSNKICSFRINELRELYNMSNSVIRLFQQDVVVKSQLMLEYMRNEYADTGELHPDFNKLERNLIGLLDKIRKQDEGIKIRGEMTITHDKLRQIIDIQASKIKEAEFKDVKGNKQQVANASIFRAPKDSGISGSD